MQTQQHDISLISHQSRRLLLKMTDTSGAPLPEGRYAVTGRVARYGSSCAIEAAPWGEPGTLLLTIPPLVAGVWNYDIFALREDGVSSRLLEGCIEADDRVTPPSAPEHTAAETVTVELSDTVDAITVTVSEITAIAAADWEDIRGAADRAERAAGQAEATLPALEREIAAARTTIEQEADQAARHAAAETADIIAAAGDTAKADIHAAAVRDAAAALDLIDAATAKGTDTLTAHATQQADRLASAAASGVQQVQAAVTEGTGTLDAYVASTSADLARKSQPNIWSGVATFNGPVIINGGASVTSSPPVSTPPVQQAAALTSLSHGLYAAGAYGPVTIPITGVMTNSGDAIAVRVAPTAVTVAGPASTLGGWRTAYAYMTPYLPGDLTWVRPNGTYNYTVRQSAVYCIRIAPGVLDPNLDLAGIGRPVMVGVWAAPLLNGGHAVSAPAPILRRPWDPTNMPAPTHSNWGQPYALEIHAAYGHAAPSILVSSGNATQGLTRGAVRYLSPIADPPAVRDIWVLPGGDAPHGTQVMAHIVTRDGIAVRLRYGISGRSSDLSVVARSIPGKRAAIACGGVAAYPCTINLPGSNAEGNGRIPHIHPVQSALDDMVTHDMVAHPTNASILPPLPGRAVVLDYTAAAPETTPYLLAAGNNAYGRYLTVAASAQDIAMTLPAGVVADVDTWSQDWCVLDGSALRLAANDTGADRYVSIWYYDPSRMPSLIWEVGITQLS